MEPTTSSFDTNNFDYTAANTAKSKYCDLFKMLGNNLSKSIFDEFQDELEVEIDIDVSGFRNKLTNAITADFKQMWNDVEIDKSLTHLDMLKKYTKDQQPKWRPTGKSVEEQTKPCRLHLLYNKLQYLEKTTTFQREQLIDLVVEIEEKRKLYHEISNRRGALEHQITLQTEQLIQNTEELKILNLKVNSVSEELQS